MRDAGSRFDQGRFDRELDRGLRRLFEPRFFFLDSHGFDIAPDGQRILVNTLIVSPRAPTRIARN